METTTFRTFYYSLETLDEKRAFRHSFLTKTKLSASSFDNYKKVDFLKHIPYVYARILIEVANELCPKFSHLLIEN